MTRKMEPSVSFVVPCFNYGSYLGDCLTSILSQDGAHDFEILVIDDGSTDSTGEVLRACPDSRLRIIAHPVNRGVVATVNEGVSLARGRFIARIDADDRYRPCFLATVLEKLNAYPGVGVVYGDVALIDHTGRVTQESSDRVHGGMDFHGREFRRLLEANVVASPTLIARREVWRQAFPIPEPLAFDDWYYTLMMARRAEFYYVHRVVAECRVHPANHHTRIVREGKEEPSIFWLLDRIFSDGEALPEIGEPRERVRRRVYGAHYLTLADKYFGLRMRADARRCYLRAVRLRPDYWLRADVVRRLIATFIGYAPYEGLKTAVKSLARLRSVG